MNLDLPNILAIDFDGTIVEFEFPGIGKLRKNAVEVINRLHDEGFHIIIWTCRHEEALDKALEFLKEQGIKYHRVNEHHEDIPLLFGNECRKIFAHMYIDDMGLYGVPDDWEITYQLIKQKFKK